MKNLEDRKKKRAEYQRDWQKGYRARLKKQGFRVIRVLVHRDFESDLREFAQRDVARRLKHD